MGEGEEEGGTEFRSLEQSSVDRWIVMSLPAMLNAAEDEEVEEEEELG